jgi:glutamate:Na+ symporter, ESS family
MPVPVIKINAVQVLALSAFGVVLGRWLKDKVPALDRLNIPASIVGGLVYAFAIFAMRDRVMNFEMDTVLQNILMVCFFTTIGLGASLRLAKEGGTGVVAFFCVAAIGAVLQNVLGISLAKAFGIDPLLGIVAGSISLTGGPATALSLGGTFQESFGVAAARETGVASAMFGIALGGLMGGYIGGSLIRRDKLKAEPSSGKANVAAMAHAHDEPAVHNDPTDGPAGDSSTLFNSVLLICVVMGIGSIFSLLLEGWLKSRNIVFPNYIGAMIAAALVRNLNDSRNWFGFSQQTVDDIGETALNIFVVMALFSLRLWELINLAVPLIVILLLQAGLVWLMSMFLAYRVMGRNYESAVMAGGFCGFMMGTTANSMACMNVLTEKHGAAPRAYIVVPIVGTFLIDPFNALISVSMAGIVR